MNYRGRQQRLIDALGRHRCGAMLVTHLPNVRYLCGFTGSSGVLAVVAGNVSQKPKLAFFTDGRYTQQAREQVVGAKIVIDNKPTLSAAAEWLATGRETPQVVGFEAEHVSVAARSALSKAVAGRFSMRALTSVVEKLRTVKELNEISQIRAAINLASTVFDAVVDDIKPGVLESGIAAEIEYMCRRLGAEGMSFDTLVSSGVRSALPHGVASQNPVPSKGFVILDFGVILAGYCSDMTRTVHVGLPGREASRMYAAVFEAQLAGIAAVKPGVETAEVDYAARNVLKKAGLGRYFTHSTGHGVGLEIHERPSLRKGKIGPKPKTNRAARVAPADRLQPGMVVTVEPGVYIPDKGGVRIEDMVLVTESGCEVLTPTRKDLIVL